MQVWFILQGAQSSNSGESHCNLTHVLCIQLKHGKVGNERKGNQCEHYQQFQAHALRSEPETGGGNLLLPPGFSVLGSQTPPRAGAAHLTQCGSLLKLHLFRIAQPLKANQHLIWCQRRNPFQIWIKSWFCWFLKETIGWASIWDLPKGLSIGVLESTSCCIFRTLPAHERQQFY